MLTTTMAVELVNTPLTVSVRSGDLSSELLDRARATGVAAMDSETTGLDWRDSRLRLVQVHVPGVGTELIRVADEGTAANLCKLLTDEAIVKVFHHAAFDLGFYRARWGVDATNVRCTKVAAKLLWPGARDRQSLKSLLREELGVDISKKMQLSDWSANKLSSAQVAYATEDVLHLVTLLGRLQNHLESRGMSRLAAQCWDHLPTRVELDALAIGDPFTY